MTKTNEEFKSGDLVLIEKEWCPEGINVGTVVGPGKNVFGVSQVLVRFSNGDEGVYTPRNLTLVRL